MKLSSGRSGPAYAPWLIAALMTIVATLEYLTPSEYVFGYLYTGAILLATARLSQRATLVVTTIAIGLTLANLWIPASLLTLPIVADRLIAALALGVTGFLGDRLRRTEAAITQQQSRLQSQEQLASVREDFVSTLTHDLRTPLLGAIETIKALQRGEFGAITPAQQQVFQTMTRSHQTSLQLVQTLLDVYRNDTEGLSLHLQPVDLAVLAEETIVSLRDLASPRRVHLSLLDAESDFRRSLWVEGDALQLRRVFANLLTNGINHSPRGGRVEVVLESQPNYQVVMVRDEGQGITQAELPLLFDRFYQGHGDRQAKGSGLGLYLTRQIVEAHKGDLWAANRSPQGAVFGFRLPAIAGRPDRATES